MRKISIKELHDTVLSGNYCSGCGVCAAYSEGSMQMRLDQNGTYIPVLNSVKEEEITVCPFADHQTDYRQFGKKFFDNQDLRFNPVFGYYLKIRAGYVTENHYRKKGSSGGGVTWFTDKLLEEKMVDYVVSVKETNSVNPRFEYTISAEKSANRETSKSKYYPVTLENSLKFIRKNPGRYAVVALPCFAKGIRLLQENEEIFRKRIRFVISIFCGHLKSTHYLSSLVSQFDVEEKDVARFDFRYKIPGRKASDYGTKIVLKNGKEIVKRNKDLFGTDWGWGLFKLKACDYCDDTVGELADISFGDAWLTRYENDYLGTNIIVTRHSLAEEIIQKSVGKGYLYVENLTENDLIRSQAPGMRHKSEGLAYRLYLNRKKGKWSPPTRVEPEKIQSRKRRKIYELRMQLQNVSFFSPHYDRIEKLKKEIEPLVKKLNRTYEHSAWTKVRLWIKQKLKSKKF